MLHLASYAPTPPSSEGVDQRTRLHGVSWEDFERLLALRGDSSSPRVAYLDGELEFMSPSIDHERIKTTLARLVEAYADHAGLELDGFGSWTLKSRPKSSGLEPDECYVLNGPKARPDLAIEVVWTSGGIEKLEIYRRLGVGEVWLWDEGAIGVYVLRGEQYAAISQSELLPGLDVTLLARLCTATSQRAAVAALRQTLATP